MSNGTSNRTSFRNWAGTVTATPEELFQPRNEEDIVAKLIESDASIRPLGAGHSFTAVAATDAISLQLDHLSGLISVDRENMTATFYAGTRLRDIPGLLADYHVALPNQGDVDPQALAGAVSTGTHGTGLGFTGFGGIVQAFTLIDASGTRHECAADAPGVAGELFRLARVGLGVFGVITTITISVVEAFYLAADEHREPLEQIRDEFVERCRRQDHVEFFWFPGAKDALVKQNRRLSAAEVETSEIKLPKPQRSFFSEEIVNNGGLRAMCELARFVPPATRGLNAVATKAVSRRKYLDQAHRVFVSSRRVRFSEMEYAIALDDMPEVLKEIAAVIDRNRAWASFPLEIRAAAADDVALSTAYQRDSAYIAVHQYHKQPYQHYFFNLIEPIFRAAAGRPHWGKLHTMGYEDFREAYPLFDDACNLRQQLDPNDRFLNNHLRSIFLPN